VSDIHYLFRFRDLVAKTIEEHRKVILEQKWCWWGWWKRPSEDSRSDIWSGLAEETKGGTSVEIALFDSGSGKVYRAKVSGVIEPSSDGMVRVPDDQTSHIPSYYRESPFSRAWIKITDIDPKPIDFFGHYSFTEAPTLPTYTQATLKRFVDKRITSADELTGMDTTIWRIRPSKPSDPSEQILLSVRALSEPVSTEVVKCKSDDILHLTDVHFAGVENRDQHVWRYESEGGARHTMVDAIATALGNRKIGLLIISGDFAFIGSTAEFDEAKTAVLRLLGILDLSVDHLIIVPGNHDIQWTTNKVYDPNAPVKVETPEAPEAAKANYAAFYRSLMRHEPNKTLSMGRRFALPCGLTIEICALNSSSLETGKKFLAGMGRIDEGAFADVAQMLGWTTASTLALRVLVIHHHLALTEDLEPEQGYGLGYGLAVDAVRVQRMAASKGVHLALHGHKHRSFIWRSSVYELPERAQLRYQLGELSIVGGGSGGSKETDGFSNYFNVIGVRPSELALEIFRSINTGAFEVFSKWNAELTLKKAEGLKLADWTKSP
jgi:3',5'-cyclic AMP phosphodiesterase CpdA